MEEISQLLIAEAARALRLSPSSTRRLDDVLQPVRAGRHRTRIYSVDRVRAVIDARSAR